VTEPLQALVDEVQARALAVESPDALEALRTEVIGRKGGRLSQVMAALAGVPKEQKAEFGRRANDAKRAIEDALGQARSRLESRRLDAALTVRYDPTFGAIANHLGSLHPLRQTLDVVVDFFRSRGFAVVLGPEVEDEFHAFEALNIPRDHPARDAMDTFYLPGGGLLRPHTSPMQIRAMLEAGPPIALLAPGRVYRRDAVDANHAFMFHQIEGLHVDRGITFGHLKGFATDLCRHLFGPGRRTRLRPSYFQFTEPSAEVDVSCHVCDGSGCRTCKGSGWIEMGGSGMVHPNVLRAVGYDPEAVSGWAWGLGLDRIAMLLHGIDDIRLLFENDPAFLAQFAVS
jgi:phenylalanyl-tRNA synthetase alpha chain